MPLNKLNPSKLNSWKELGSQLAGGNQPDPLVALKDKEINVKQQDLAAKQQQGQQKINLEKVKIGKKEESDKAKIESNEDIAELRGRIAREKLKQTAKIKEIFPQKF